MASRQEIDPGRLTSRLGREMGFSEPQLEQLRQQALRLYQMLSGPLELGSEDSFAAVAVGNALYLTELKQQLAQAPKKEQALLSAKAEGAMVMGYLIDRQFQAAQAQRNGE